MRFCNDITLLIQFQLVHLLYPQHIYIYKTSIEAVVPYHVFAHKV